LNKIFGLLVNEYIKIFGKFSTKILLGLVILVALGFNTLLYWASNNTFNRPVHFSAETPQSRIAFLEATRPDGWEHAVARYTYFLDNGIALVYAQQHPEAWRTEAVYILFNLKQAGEAAIHINAMHTAILAEDWLAFVTARFEWAVTGYSRFSSPHAAVDLWALDAIIAHSAHQDTWQYHAIQQVRAAKLHQLQHDDTNRFMNSRDIIALGLYRLANNIEAYTFRGMKYAENLSHMPDGLPPLWRSFAMSVNFIGFLGVLLIVVAGGIVASEHSTGTIKFLLINPVARWKFLLAKYIAVLTFGLVLLILSFLANLFFAGVFFGFDGLGAPLLSVVGGEVVHGSAVLYLFSRYLLGAVGMAVLATFAFALSALLRSSAMAVGFSLFLYFGGWTAVTLLQNMGFYQARYILFANTNILNVVNGLTGFIHHTLAFALLNIAAYMAVFLWTAWDSFVRADIK
jgi:ABC-2 type transport system permease protein